MATARGNYIGPPLGNMYLDWERWVRERLIDELCIGVYGGCWGRGEDSNTSYGHLCNPKTGVGMNPIEKDINEVYGPVCSQHGCELILPEYSIPKDEEGVKFVKEHPKIDGLLVWVLPGKATMKGLWTKEPIK